MAEAIAMSEQVEQALADITEGSAFVSLLNSEGQVKLLDVFLTKSYAWLSQEELAEYADVDQSTVSRNLKTLIDIGAVRTNTDVSEDSTHYALDEGAEFVDALQEVHLQLLPHAETALDARAEDYDERGQSQPPVAGSRSYTTGSAFVELFRTKGQVKLLDVLLTKSYAWLSDSELVDLSGLNRQTVRRNRETLQEMGLVQQKEGSWPRVYALDTDHCAAEALEELHLQLLPHAESLWEIEVAPDPELKRVRDTVLDDVQSMIGEWVPDRDRSATEYRISETARHPTTGETVLTSLASSIELVRDRANTEYTQIDDHDGAGDDADWESGSRDEVMIPQDAAERRRVAEA
jgi:DNA-binding IclR family transcriptional regulator